jgi:hypothetical protein
VNHGFHDARAPYQSPVDPWYLTCWQADGAAHNDTHEDPSQGGRWVRLECMIETGSGITYTTIPEVLQSAEWASLISHTGVLNHVRQPRAGQ